MWNLRWAKSASRRGRRISEILVTSEPEIAILTEVTGRDFMPGGEVIDSAEDYGYPLHPGRRKVQMWSATGWSDIDRSGDPGLPSGRFAAGTTETSIGPIRVAGVCIPWRDAHVSHGRRDRTRWEANRIYLEGLARVLKGPEGAPHVVAGDFNQRLPRKYQPPDVHSALESAFPQGWTVATAGSVEGISRQLIDHVAHDASLRATSVRAFAGVDPKLGELSDHAGVVVEVERV